MDFYQQMLANGAITETPEEIERKRRRMLPRATSRSTPGGALTTSVTPGAGFRDLSRMFTQAGLEAYNAEPDVSSLREFAKQRSQEGEGAMLNALAAGYAGKRFEPVQAQFLKRAMSAQEPLKVGSAGYITPRGEFVKDPTYQSERRAETMLRLGQQYGNLAQDEQAANERLSTQRDLAAIRASTSGNQMGSFSPTGFTPEGKPIVTNSKSGMSYLIDVTPDGMPSYTPYTGANIPKASYEKSIVEGSDFANNIANADRLIGLVEGNPGAFGVRGYAVSSLPSGMQGYAASAMRLTPEQLQVRSEVLREAAMQINQLYGAALSMGEQVRAATFLPDGKDTPEMILTKLRAARDWAKSKLGNLPQGVQSSVGQRVNTGEQRRVVNFNDLPE